MPYSSTSPDFCQLDKVTSFSDSIVVQNAHDLIDQEICHLNSYICALKSRRNSIVPVSRLPPEILAEIFLILAEQIQSNRFKTSFSWLFVAHVCKLWRRVALDHGVLWGRIDTVFQPRTEEFLVRSKGAPLALRQSIGGTLAALSLPLNSDIPYRFREFHLQATGRIENDVLQLISSPVHAPILESIVIDISDDSSDLTLASTGFGDLVPHLHRLQLNNVRIQWPMSFFPRLTHLAIHHSGGNFAARPTVSHVLDVLQNMPCLEVLHLVDQQIFELPDSSTPPIDKTVSLPHLSTLHLFGTVSDCIALTSHLSLACFVNLQLHCTDVTNVSEVEVLLRFIKENFNLLHSRSTSPMRIHIDCTVEKFIITSETYPQRLKPLVSDVGLYSRDTEFFRVHNAGICTAMVSAVPSGLAKRICIQNTFPTSSATWLALLEMRAEVRALDVFFNGAVNLPDVLGSEAVLPDVTASDTASPQFYCPKLQILTFYGISFRRQTSLGQSFSEALLDCLKKRSNGSSRIRALAFNSCADVEQGVAMQFRNFVHKVHWDDDLEDEFFELHQ